MRNIIFLTFIGLFVSCAKNSNQTFLRIENEISNVNILYNRLDNFVYFYGNVMDDIPEDFLKYQKNDLESYVIADCDSLELIRNMLNKSMFVDASESSTFDTDICILINYSNGDIDTLGFAMDNSKGFLINNNRAHNPDLIDYVFDSLVPNSYFWNKDISRLRWNGNFKYYSAPFFDSKSNENPNYGLFENTPAQGLAKCMALEELDSIDYYIKENSSIMYYRDCDLMPIVFHCIQFQQDTVLHLFLDNGFDPNYHECIDDTKPLFHTIPPLMVACENPYYNKCGFLLIHHGADVNVNCSNYGRFSNPLSVAISRRNYEMVKFLISHGADVNVKSAYSAPMPVEEYPLDIAIKMGYYKVTLLLLENGANIETPYIKLNGGIRSILNQIDLSNLSNVDLQYLYLINELIHHMP